MSPGLLTQQEFIRALEADPEVREIARQMAESRRRPQAIKRSQSKAWGEVKRKKKLLDRATIRLQRSLQLAKKLNLATAEWEAADKNLQSKLVSLCHAVRDRASRAEIEAVRKIQRKLTTEIREQAVRVPLLRRVLSRSRSRPPTQLGNSGSASG